MDIFRTEEWRWGRQVSLPLHGGTSQNTVIFIVTVMRTPDLTGLEWIGWYIFCDHSDGTMLKDIVVV